MDLVRLGRRNFLRASALTALTILGGHPVLASEPAAQRLPPGRLSLYNIHTGESLLVTYRDPLGEYDLEALDAVNRLLRCHYTGSVHEIDLQTLEFLNDVNRLVGGSRQVHVISGFRSPEYNELLRSKGRRVAEKSLHLLGKAVDVRIPGVRLEQVRKAALSLRCGGVGYYPRSRFVHLDSGDIRTW